MAAYLDGFSKRNSGRMADLQILSDELGTQEQAEMLPFEGITLETTYVVVIPANFVIR